MKEYLSLPERQDENTETSENNEPEANSAEENSPTVNHENGNGVNESSKDETKLEKDSASKSSSIRFRQFKNVVAIVDPPRVGLHPTVSDPNENLLHAYYESLLFFVSTPVENAGDQSSSDTISFEEACVSYYSV